MMKMKRLFMLVVLSLLVAGGLTAQDKAPGRRESSNRKTHQKMETSIGKTTPKLWWDNYDFALKAAKKENKAVLLMFTGSDWCGWCKKLHKDFLDKEDFKKMARKTLIPVFLDFPSDRVTLPSELVEQNANLLEEYGVSGYPTLYVLNPKGEKVGQLGYNKDFQKQLEGLVERALDKKKADRKDSVDDAKGSKRKHRKGSNE